MKPTASNPSKNNMLHHYMWLRAALNGAGAEAILSCDNLDVLVRRAGRHWRLHARFLAVHEGRQQYTAQVSPEVNTFAGWLPYELKQWPLGADKLAFKRYAREAQLPVPDYSLDPRSELADVIVKRVHSSFGAQIAGPYRDARQHPLNREQGEYYERFVEGRILKIWFWEGQPLCLEMDDMPFVVGDGSSTLGQLIMGRAELYRRHDAQQRQRLLDDCAPLLGYFNRHAGTVLPKGARQLVEFRYGSYLLHPRGRQVVDLRAEPIAALMPTLETAGLRLLAAIPAAVRRHTLFTVDAILDRHSQLWLLEMNCNPAVHPLAYPAMLSGLLAPPSP
jgi:hypothetical protein